MSLIEQTHFIPMIKLTRKQIAEGLEAMPIDKLLLGNNTTHKVKLTAKQMQFAEEVAKGTPKAKAYRKAYNSKGKPTTQAQEASRLAKNPHITAMIEAQQQAIEAAKYQTPQHLRALTIHELTKHALDKAMPPAQRIKCLELLGKITEVALFTERREVIKVESQEAMREKLVNAVKLAIGTGETIEATYTSANDLMAELKSVNSNDESAGHYDGGNTEPAEDNDNETQGGEASTISTDATPRTPDPLNQALPTSLPLHSNPHIESIPISASTMPTYDENDDAKI